MTFHIAYKSSVKKELKNLSQVDRQAIVQKIVDLADNPLPQGSAKLKGSRNLYRIRHGDYRVIYSLQNNELMILIIRIGHRREVYRKI